VGSLRRPMRHLSTLSPSVSYEHCVYGTLALGQTESDQKEEASGRSYGLIACARCEDCRSSTVYEQTRGRA
jgi:hypothetical protein